MQRRRALGAVVVIAGLLGVWTLVEARFERRLVGVWTQTTTRDGVTDRREWTFLPDGVYVIRTTYAGGPFPPEGKTTIESGIYRHGEDRLDFTVIEGDSIARGVTYHASRPTIDGDELLFAGGETPSRWSRVRDLAAGHDPERRTEDALRVARAELGKASGCLLGGRLDAGPAWERFRGQAHARALLPIGEDDVDDDWLAPCAASLQAAFAALEGLETEVALDRCGPLRRALRMIVQTSPQAGHTYGPVLGDEANIDTIAAAAAQCGIADGETTVDPARSVEGEPVPPRAVPLQVVGIEQHTRFAIATPTTASVRFVGLGPATHEEGGPPAVACTTLGRGIDAIDCASRFGRLRVAEVLPALGDDAPVWVLDGASKAATLTRPGHGPIPLKGNYRANGAAFVAGDGTVRGLDAAGWVLEAPADGDVREVRHPGLAGAIARGDLRLTSRDGHLHLERVDAAGAPTKLGEVKTALALRAPLTCHDGSGFGLVAHDGVNVVAALPRADGALDLVDAKIAVDANRDRPASVTCGRGWIQTTWFGADSRAHQLRCTPQGCVARQSGIVRVRHRSSFTPAIVAVGERVLVARHAMPSMEAGVGARIVYRVAPIEELAGTRERLLLADDTRSTADRLNLSFDPAVASTGEVAVVLVPSAKGLFVFRVDRDGTTRPLGPAGG